MFGFMKEEESDIAMLESQLYSTLTKADLVQWIPVFATLALRFRGLEEVMEPCDATPLRQMLNLSLQAAAFQPAWRERLLFHRLARLPVFCWQAANMTGRWDPLAESLSEFANRGNPSIWQDWRPCPAPVAVEHWLRGQLRVHGQRGP